MLDVASVSVGRRRGRKSTDLLPGEANIVGAPDLVGVLAEHEERCRTWKNGRLPAASGGHCHIGPGLAAIGGAVQTFGGAAGIGNDTIVTGKTISVECALYRINGPGRSIV